MTRSQLRDIMGAPTSEAKENSPSTTAGFDPQMSWQCAEFQFNAFFNVNDRARQLDADGMGELSTAEKQGIHCTLIRDTPPAPPPIVPPSETATSAPIPAQTPDPDHAGWTIMSRALADVPGVHLVGGKTAIYCATFDTSYPFAVICASPTNAGVGIISMHISANGYRTTGTVEFGLPDTQSSMATIVTEAYAGFPCSGARWQTFVADAAPLRFDGAGTARSCAAGVNWPTGG
jgi:hypothetical protein